MFTGFDWNHPGASTWTAPPFFTFTTTGTLPNTNRLGYTCIYSNPTNRTIRAGDSVSTDEEVQVVGYFFGAGPSLVCLNSLSPPHPLPF